MRHVHTRPRVGETSAGAYDRFRYPVRLPRRPECRLGFVEAIGHAAVGPCTLCSALGGGKMIQIYLGLLFSAAVAA
jgi:hypothetical protein